jgi:hypothetical protein
VPVVGAVWLVTGKFVTSGFEMYEASMVDPVTVTVPGVGIADQLVKATVGAGVGVGVGVTTASGGFPPPLLHPASSRNVRAALVRIVGLIFTACSPTT